MLGLFISIDAITSLLVLAALLVTIPDSGLPRRALATRAVPLLVRARGIEADRGVIARLAAFPGRSLGLLIAAIRRATRLAIAMDARGFGSRACRTLARPRAFTRDDLLLVAGAFALVALATAVSVA